MKTWLAKFRASVEELSTEQVALLLCVGLVAGVFPIMGCPTVLCLLLGLGLRLNLAALQLLNNISSPLQLALLIPLARAGAWLCGGAVSGNLATGAAYAIAGWACICIPLGAILYVVLLGVMRHGRPLWCNIVKSPA